MMMWFAGMAAAALVTNTSSPEPRNSALLNFMKGLAVQFMSLPAEDTSVQRQRKHCSTTSDEITQNKKFYPWQHFFLSLYSEMQTQDTVLDCSYKRGKETCQLKDVSIISRSRKHSIFQVLIKTLSHVFPEVESWHITTSMWQWDYFFMFVI